MKSKISASIIILAIALVAGCGGNTTTPPAPVPAPGPTPVSVVFTSTPPVSASQGQSYVYAVTASAGTATVTYQLASGPGGATLTGNTLTWTPTTSQARVANSFSVVATANGVTSHQDWSVTPAGVVQGTKITTHLTDAGSVQSPQDTSVIPVGAMVPAAGGYNTLTATGSPAGDYTFASLPGGYFWLDGLLQTYFWTNLSAVDLGSDTLGRPTAALPSNPIQLRFELTGLNPWQTTDRQQLYVANNGTSMSRDWSAWGLAAGSTSLDQTISWTDPMLDSSEEDKAYVTQLVTTPTLTSSSVLAVKKASGELEIETTDAGSLVVEGALTDVPLNLTMRGNIHGSAFAQLESAMNPAAIPDSTYFYVDVQPGGLAKGWVGTTPDLVIFDGTGNPIRTDTDMGDIAFGNPYPAEWSKFFDYIQYVRVNYTAPGATNSVSDVASIEVQSASLPTSSAAVVPVIGPVQNPKVNNSNFFNAVSSAGATPVISWNAPALGTATGYIVEVFHLYNNDVDSVSEYVGKVYTKTTSIQLPTGYLTVGNSYYFRISAIAEPGVDYEAAPLRHAFPRSVAQSLSGVVTP
ncbi:MAG TPA: hypothetical protein VEW69_09665 [Alphaproteobacteria bacterium]|nr:hypothetical protein [Alphaproteobacteria bacterium]